MMNFGRGGNYHRQPRGRQRFEHRGAQRIDDDDHFRSESYSGAKPVVKNKQKLTKRDRQRAEVYRERKNEESGYDAIAADIDKILHPGFASLANAVKDLSIVTKAAKVIPISTIAVGPMVQESVNTVRMTVRHLPENFDRHAFYRVALGMLDTRLYTQFKMRSRTVRSTAQGFQETWVSSDRRDLLLGHRHHFLSFMNYLNAVGNFVHNEVQYYVGVPQVNTPCTVTLQNLRTCIQLATNGPVSVRRLFFEHNPFPFAVYDPDGPALLNGDDICPPNYSDQMFRNDLQLVKMVCAIVQRKFPKKIGDSIDYASNGHRAILVSSISDSHEKFRAVPEHDLGPQIDNMTGIIDSFWSSEPNLTDQDFYYGSLILAGHHIQFPRRTMYFNARSEELACLSANTNALSNMRVHY